MQYAVYGVWGGTGKQRSGRCRCSFETTIPAYCIYSTHTYIACITCDQFMKKEGTGKQDATLGWIEAMKKQTQKSVRKAIETSGVPLDYY